MTPAFRISRGSFPAEKFQAVRAAFLASPGNCRLGRRSRARICAPDRFTIGLCPKRASICQRAAKAADCSNCDYDSVMIGCTPMLFLLRF
jgi:hypothetical protein